MLDKEDDVWPKPNALKDVKANLTDFWAPLTFPVACKVATDVMFVGWRLDEPDRVEGRLDDDTPPPGTYQLGIQWVRNFLYHPGYS